MSNNYYDHLLEKIRKLIEEEEYQQANDILDEEIGMPFTPRDVLIQLEELKEEVRYYLPSEMKSRQLSEEQLREYLLRNDDYSYQAVDYLAKSNIRNYLDAVKEVLSDASCPRMISALLLEVLHKQNVDEYITYWFEGQRHVVNPSSIGDPIEYDVIVNTMMYLQKLLENDNPAFLSHCQSVLMQYAYLCYPAHFISDYKILTASIIRYVYRSYDDEAGFRKFAREKGLPTRNLDDLSIVLQTKSI